MKAILTLCFLPFVMLYYFIKIGCWLLWKLLTVIGFILFLWWL